ncbi:MAG: D-alanine--D-alanine ligase [Candidatus Omnitrophica bacterium]|nr:D-alanine--D-alanine ligase [Candidatus Omnitrophota bacterium]
MENCNLKFGCIGVLMGGYSSEREVSLRSGKAILDALLAAGCDAKGLDIQSEDEREIKKQIQEAKIDVAFIALHGKLGEDGKIQNILEQLNLPYTGSGVQASQLSINKVLAHMIFNQNGIKTPEYVALHKSDEFVIEDIIKKLGGKFPLVVKPACEGSSIGIHFAESKETLLSAIESSWQFVDQVLIEQFIKGRELTVGILGNDCLPVIEIKPKRDFFDYTAKYQKGLTDYLIPAPLPEELAGKVQKLAFAAYKSLGCEDLSRVDVMLDEKDQPFVLEINTIPGFTETSLLPKAARQAGVDFQSLCLRLVGMAYGKSNQED